ncbi:MAG: U32 family peptidase [Kiritimatiellae bacterium]|nr:U32 family peptidase [Kiritimatiellia bacterium]
MSCELLAPAGDFDTALAAYEAGADAVYAGLREFSARAYAGNLSLEETEKLVRLSRERGRKLYITFNTLINQDEMPRAIETLGALEDIGVDAVILQDIGVASLCRKNFPSLQMHASTQMAVHNLEGLSQLSELGFKRTVLARELSLEEIQFLAKRRGAMELETFIHGALCYSISGLCLYSAMEKGRSGNRGKCAYCCRMPHADNTGVAKLPFSMRDLRLGEDVLKLAAAGVESLKIEGRMKSQLYVSTVVTHYRDILDGAKERVSKEDLETVFSRKTTNLYFSGSNDEVTDPNSPLGHLGTAIGVVKRVATDRYGAKWLRFHTSRALEKHDGLQFEIKRRPPANEKAAKWAFAGTAVEKVGFGISEMRSSISRSNVYQVPADSDVEVLLPPDFPVQAGQIVYCSMSNELKRRFPLPSYRESQYPGLISFDVKVTLAKDGISANDIKIDAKLEVANDTTKTYEAVKKAFSKTGGTRFKLGNLVLEDPYGLYAPMSILNDLRRKFLDKLQQSYSEKLDSKIAALSNGVLATEDVASKDVEPVKRIKHRADQKLPKGDWAEIIIAINLETKVEDLPPPKSNIRLSVPLWNPEPSFSKLRTLVKRLIRAGYTSWECTDLATMRMLRLLEIEDITADWSLYVFNNEAASLLSSFGVKRFTCSPENDSPEALIFTPGCRGEFIVQQSTPLFISLSKPGCEIQSDTLRVYKRDDLYVTVKRVPKIMKAPNGADTRVDLSWDPPEEEE